MGPAHAGALYLSEDNFAFPSGFYKYVPPVHPRRAGRLEDGGSLYMVKIKGVTNADLAQHQEPGAKFRVEWVKIDEPTFDFGRPTAPDKPTVINDEALQFVSQQGLVKGAAKFSRLEGTIYAHGWVYFTSTQGGLSTDPTQVGLGVGVRQGLRADMGLRHAAANPAPALRVARP